MPNQYTTKGQPKRTRMVPVRFTEDEFFMYSEQARGNKCSLSDYIRYCLTLETLGTSQARSKLRREHAARRKSAKEG